MNCTVPNHGVSGLGYVRVCNNFREGRSPWQTHSHIQAKETATQYGMTKCFKFSKCNFACLTKFNVYILQQIYLVANLVAALDYYYHGEISHNKIVGFNCIHISRYAYGLV